jgi:hypothetical protein
MAAERDLISIHSGISELVVPTRRWGEEGLEVHIKKKNLCHKKEVCNYNPAYQKAR